MIKFSKGGIQLSIATGCNPTENWLNTHSELITLLQRSSDSEPPYHVLELLRSMMPDAETAKRMIEPKAATII